MKSVAVVATLLLVVMGSAAAYFAVGWQRMDTHCSADPPGHENRGGVSYSWSWSPLGFTCDYRSGASETSLWF